MSPILYYTARGPRIPAPFFTAAPVQTRSPTPSQDLTQRTLCTSAIWFGAAPVQDPLPAPDCPARKEGAR
jgi:hypothetical protein